MSVYDKREKRMAEIRRGIENGKIDPASGAARLARYKAKPPEYWVKGFAYGKWYDEPAPDRSSIKSARAHDRRLKVKIEDNTYTPADLLKAKLGDIFKAHLKAQAGKGGEGAAKSRAGRAIEIFGHIRLDKLHANPRPILEKGFNLLPAEWVQTTRWHFWGFMKAAIDRYKRAHPVIQINNPMTAYPLSRGNRRRDESPTLVEHLEVLSHIKSNPFRWETRPGKGPKKVGYPAYLYALMVIRGEQGLRGMEVIPWRFERMDLEARRPAVMTRILKKDGVKADQWVVLTPTAYRALKAYLETLPGPKEYGAVWPVKNWPTDLVRRALDACGLQHLVAHDWRRFWTMKHIDKNKDRRKAAVGRETDDSEEFYKHFNREAQEEFYSEEWANFEKNNSETRG